jgi:uncharacterized protein
MTKAPMTEIVFHTLDAATAHAARLFVASVTKRYAVRAAFLYGSRSRNDFRPDSDADIAVLLEGPQRPFLATKLELADLAYDVLLETGVYIQPMPFWEMEWEHPEAYSNPRLIENIQREGIPL